MKIPWWTVPGCGVTLVVGLAAALFALRAWSDWQMANDGADLEQHIIETHEPPAPKARP